MRSSCPFTSVEGLHVKTCVYANERCQCEVGVDPGNSDSLCCTFLELGMKSCPDVDYRELWGYDDTKEKT